MPPPTHRPGPPNRPAEPAVDLVCLGPAWNNALVRRTRLAKINDALIDVAAGGRFDQYVARISCQHDDGSVGAAPVFYSTLPMSVGEARQALADLYARLRVRGIVTGDEPDALRAEWNDSWYGKAQEAAGAAAPAKKK